MVRKDTELVQNMLNVALSLSSDLEAEETWKVGDYSFQGDNNDDAAVDGNNMFIYCFYCICVCSIRALDSWT
jgi:hypothetical protein